MDMRERIARAMYEREKARAENATEVLSGAAGRPVNGMAMEPWEECRDTYLGDADAVLEAMREPTEEMLAIFGIHRSVMASNWQAMIDAARP